MRFGANQDLFYTRSMPRAHANGSMTNNPLTSGKLRKNLQDFGFLENQVYPYHLPRGSPD
jgi:hypothetical protein